jgi:uncharacterized protein (DUF58 family)
VLAALRLRTVERIAHWARKRQGEDVPPLLLRARRLYILPTRAGYTAGVLLFVMLIAGLNYTNSLALLLTFVLAGFVLVGMHECQRTLQGLEVLRAQAADCYAGLAGTLELRLANGARASRRSLTVRAAPEPAIHFDLAAGAQLSLEVPHRCARRGRHSIGRLELASTAPFGLFRCWTWLHLPLEVIVYPSPLGTRPLPPPAAGRAARVAPSPASGEDEWASLRAYQPGDSPRSIAWKTVARGGPFMVGQYAGADGSDYRLSFAGLEALDLEARLSQLCAWADECARIGAACELDLPDARVPLGRGANHRTTLLRALALYGTAAP